MAMRHAAPRPKQGFAARGLVICALPTLRPVGYYLYLNYMGDYWYETGYDEYWRERKANEALWQGDWQCDLPDSPYPYCVERRREILKAHPDYEPLHDRSGYRDGYQSDAKNWAKVAAAALGLLLIPPFLITVVTMLRRNKGGK